MIFRPSPRSIDRSADQPIDRPDAEFQAVAARVVAKNQELYRRLA